MVPEGAFVETTPLIGQTLRIERRDWLFVSLAGFVGIVLHQFIQLNGLKTTSATNTGWILTLIPPVTGILGWFWLKERVAIQQENQTLASITFQNLFRLYPKLAGMTGTADTEAAEFDKIYKLDVVVIPTNRPMVRKDEHDVVYRTEREKFDAVVEEIVERHEQGQPILVGTISIEKSEHLGNLLKKRGVPHVVLNAKYHEQEASIVAQAGQPGRVTISTNMAGRGTDILLGGNPEFLAKQRSKGKTVEEYGKLLEEAKAECAKAHEEVIAAGGLHIIGTERHESRRIDNQLRGRAGRQGDPGSSRFFLSLEDDLMRIFGTDRLSGLMQRLGMEEGVPIEHRWVTRSIERAQKQVEARNFDTRKHLLEYDDVMNKQREEIYRLRKEILTGALSHEYVINLAEDVSEDYVDRHCPASKDRSEWDWKALSSILGESFGISPEEAGLSHDDDNNAALKEKLKAALRKYYEEKSAKLGADVMKDFEKFFMLQSVDALWKDHLLALDHLKEGIGLRGYGQRDPLIEYKKESFQLFEAVKEAVEEQILQNLFRFEIVREQEADARFAPPAAPSAAPEEAAPASGGVSAPALTSRAAAELERRAQRQRREMTFQGTADPTAGGDFRVDTVKSTGPKVGRNDPCPCGSGKKYKKCHGATATGD